MIIAMAANPCITISEMAVAADITGRTVQRYLKEFQEAGALKREGSDKNGKWIVL